MNETQRENYIKASVEEVGGFAIALLGVITAIVIGYAWGGYVFSILWAWFVVTAFSAPTITVAQSIGVLMVVRFAAKTRTRKTEDEPDFGKLLLGAVGGPALFLAVGWIVKQWLPG